MNDEKVLRKQLEDRLFAQMTKQIQDLIIKKLTDLAMDLVNDYSEQEGDRAIEQVFAQLGEAGLMAIKEQAQNQVVNQVCRHLQEFRQD